jgi:biopolymer transport protein ExbB
MGISPGDLAGGIWEALITTAAGLMVAIPAYVGYRYLQGRVNAIVADMEEETMEIAQLIAGDTAKSVVRQSVVAKGAAKSEG